MSLELTSLKALSCSHWNRWQWFLQFATGCLCTSQPWKSKNAWLFLCLPLSPEFLMYFGEGWGLCKHRCSFRECPEVLPINRRCQEDVHALSLSWGRAEKGPGAPGATTNTDPGAAQLTPEQCCGCKNVAALQLKPCVAKVPSWAAGLLPDTLTAFKTTSFLFTLTAWNQHYSPSKGSDPKPHPTVEVLHWAGTALALSTRQLCAP